jgi:predicted transport protein
MSSDTLKQAELNQVKNLEENTGKKMEEWIVIANNSGFEKHGEILNYLKSKYGLGHGNANLVVHCAKKSHAGSAENPDDLISEQYHGKENLRPWYDRLMVEINKFGNDVEIAPKKAYVSLRRKKQFAIIQPSVKTRLDVGLNLKGISPTGDLAAAGSWNSMCTHRVKVESETQINSDLIGWIKQAYDQAG